MTNEPTALASCIALLSFSDNDLVRAARAELAELREIVEWVAGDENEPLYGEYSCVYCQGYGGSPLSRKSVKFKHDPDCIVTKARKALAERAQTTPHEKRGT